MNELQFLKENWNKAVSYSEFQKLMDDEIKKGEPYQEKEKELFHYIKLNQSRQKRWDKTFHLSQIEIESLKKLTQKYNILVITEFWCADSAQILPIINKIVEHTDVLEMRIVFRDENTSLMDMFLTDGARSIPKLIFMNPDTFEVEFTWGPRPSIATEMVEQYKRQHGKLTLEFKETLQLWYHKNKGENIVSDLYGLLKIDI